MTEPRPTKEDVAAWFEYDQTAYEDQPMDPCGECPLGTCDHCEMCVWTEQFTPQTDRVNEP